MKMEINDILKEIYDHETNSYMMIQNDLIVDFDISPLEFLSYAEKDLALDYDHNIINALSNSKRALDCQLDTLLLSFGFYKKSQKEQWSFPKKIDLMSELGLIAPRILKKINKQRNLLEHQFVKPVRETVEDFLDITMLFIASTDRYTLKFHSEINLRNKTKEREYNIQNDYKSGTIKISVYPYGKGRRLDNEKRDLLAEFKLKITDTDFKKALKVYLKFCK